MENKTTTEQLRSNEGKTNDLIVSLKVRKWWQREVIDMRSKGLKIVDASLYKRAVNEKKFDDCIETIKHVLFLIIFFVLGAIYMGIRLVH